MFDQDYLPSFTYKGVALPLCKVLFSSLGEDAHLKITCTNVKTLNYLPFKTSDQDYLPSNTLTGCFFHCVKFHLNSFWRRYAYKLTCNNLNYLPFFLHAHLQAVSYNWMKCDY